jgi:hypothetical protein
VVVRPPALRAPALRRRVATAAALAAIAQPLSQECRALLLQLPQHARRRLCERARHQRRRLGPHAAATTAATAAATAAAAAAAALAPSRRVGRRHRRRRGRARLWLWVRLLRLRGVAVVKPLQRLVPQAQQLRVAVAVPDRVAVRGRVILLDLRARRGEAQPAHGAAAKKHCRGRRA